MTRIVTLTVTDPPLTDGNDLSGGTTNFLGHDVRISEGGYDPALHGGHDRPFGTASIDGRHYYLVPVDGTVVQEAT